MAFSDVNISAHIISINGVDLSYSIFGNGDVNLIFVHGYMCEYSLYKKLISEFQEKYRVIAIDLRAHGKSCFTIANFTLDQLAEDIIEFVKNLSIDRPFFVGHSLGGALGLYSEIKSPGLYRALSLITPAPAKAEFGLLPGLVKKSIEIHQDKEKMRDLALSLYVHDVGERAIEELIASECLVSSCVHEKYLTEEWPNFDITEKLKEIKPPVLLLNGTLDSVVPISAQHQIALGLTDYKEINFSGEGHMMPFENPRKVAREVIGFFENDINDIQCG